MRLPSEKQGKRLAGSGRSAGRSAREKALQDLLAHRAMDPGVGDRTLPKLEELVLLAEAGKLPALQRVVLDVLDAVLDLALVARHPGPGRQDDRAVMAGEVRELGVDLRIEPIGLDDAGLQVIDHGPQRDPAKVPEGVLQAAQKRLGVLAPDHLRVAFPGMAQDAAKQVRPAPAVVLDAPRRRGRSPLASPRQGRTPTAGPAGRCSRSTAGRSV